MRKHHQKKKTCLFMLLVVALSLFTGHSEAEAKTKRKLRHPVRNHRALSIDKIIPYADLVIEAHTGRILHATNANEPRHPASLTKMMTLYLCFQALESGQLHLDERLPVSSHAAAQAPSKLGIKPGQSIRAYDAIMGVVTKSANDAAVVLAEALGGNEERFAQMMTRQAYELGMKHTVFRNASGLPDPNQITTAKDMAVLGHALIYHYPRYYGFFSHDSFTYAGQTHQNHNHLMERYEGMDGIKTGYVRASGFNLVASAVRGKTRLIGVIFGGKSTQSRDNRMAQLLDRGFLLKEAESSPREGTPGVEAQGDADSDESGGQLVLPAHTATMLLGEGQRQTRGREGAAKYNPATKWGIQIGAYNDPEASQQALGEMSQSMPNLLNHAEAVVEKAQTPEGTIIYRARFMGMEQPTARSICSYIVKHGRGCQVVTSEGSQDS